MPITVVYGGTRTVRKHKKQPIDFKFSSYEDYMTETQKFIELGLAELEKLRLLSLMSIAIKVPI